MAVKQTTTRNGSKRKTLIEAREQSKKTRVKTVEVELSAKTNAASKDVHLASEKAKSKKQAVAVSKSEGKFKSRLESKRLESKESENIRLENIRKAQNIQKIVPPVRKKFSSKLPVHTAVKQAMREKLVLSMVKESCDSDVLSSMEKLDAPRYQANISPSVEELESFRRVSAASREQALNTIKLVKVSYCSTVKSKGPFLKKPPKTGKRCAFDLHIHSPATSGYLATEGVDAVHALVRLAKAKGLDMIAITDNHNAALVDLICSISKDVKLRVLPGLELQCRIGGCNEVFVIALFPETYTGGDLFEILNDIGIPESLFGRQGYCIDMPFGDVVNLIELRGGVLIPCHVDKTPYRQIAVPALVEEYGFRAFNLVHPEHTNYFQERWPHGGFTFFSFSGANSLAQIGTKVVKTKLISSDFEGIKELVQREL